jgi:hypothetical protein
MILNVPCNFRIICNVFVDQIQDILFSHLFSQKK